MDYIKQFFRVMITSTNSPDSPHIFVGLISSNSMVSSSGHNTHFQQGTYLYDCQSGNAYRNGTAMEYGFSIPTDSVIEISCNNKSKLVIFSVGGEKIAFIPLASNDYNTKLFPAVMLANNSDSASFF